MQNKDSVIEEVQDDVIDLIPVKHEQSIQLKFDDEGYYIEYDIMSDSWICVNALDPDEVILIEDHFNEFEDDEEMALFNGVCLSKKNLLEYKAFIKGVLST